MSAPKIQFAAPVFDFGTVGAGTVVRHNYFFTNKGAAPLVVTEVHPTCDCTTVGEWSASLQPGQTGLIPIQFDSTGYVGAVSKQIMVACNDPATPEVILTLKGMVSNPIEVSPPNAVFTPVAGTTTSETKVIRITNHAKEPLHLSPPECTNKAFAVALQSVRPEQEFELHVTTVPPFDPGTVVGLVTIKTNSPQVPLLAVTALAVVQKEVAVRPTEIWLRGGPLPSSFQARVTIRNNVGIAGFAVSDPIVNLPGVTAVVKEVQPGRVFDILLTFPAGLELPPGSRAELTVRTTHPHFPVITVPIRQNPPAVGARANGSAASGPPGPPAEAGAAPELKKPSPSAKPASAGATK